MIAICGRQIERAFIVDDEPEARDAYEYVMEDMDIRPYQVTEELSDLGSFISSIASADVVLCDFHLKKHSYAPYDGDKLVADFFQAGVPAALCTSIAEAPIRRDHLRYIPGLVRTSSPKPAELLLAWERCLQELAGQLEPERRPWRTLVRVDDIDQERHCFYAVVPSWDVRTKVRIDNDNLPHDLRDLIEPGRRFHALVNTGSDSPRDLFFDSWEL